MQKNFSLSQNMQIPYERTYAGVGFMHEIDEKLEELSKHFKIHNIQQVKNFIRKNDGLVDYIKTVTPIIIKHFPDNEKCIVFCEDSEFEELDDITIYINSSDSEFDKDWKRLDELEMELCCINGFSTKLKGLISVDLWFK